MLWSMLSEKLAHRERIKGPDAGKGPASLGHVADCVRACVCVPVLNYNGMILSDASWICMKQEAGAMWACRYVMCMQLDRGSICLAKQDTFLTAKTPTSEHLRLVASICKQGFGQQALKSASVSFKTFFFENPNSEVLGMPINMQKLFSCSFPWSPFNLLEGGKQSPSFGHFALFPAQCTRALAHLWRYKRTLGFARTVSDSKSLYLLQGLASNL